MTEKLGVNLNRPSKETGSRKSHLYSEAGVTMISKVIKETGTVFRNEL